MVERTTDDARWRAARTYWEQLVETAGAPDLSRDPEGLANVCWPGQPLWLNRYQAELQLRAYTSLLSRVRRRGRALDVGCGAGRWCKLLADRGWDVTGIDLQPELIRRNRHRFPDLRFDLIAIQDFKADRRFDLVSSVTVIQHNPPEQQEEMVETIAGLLADGGSAIILESL